MYIISIDVRLIIPLSFTNFETIVRRHHSLRCQARRSAAQGVQHVWHRRRRQHAQHRPDPRRGPEAARVPRLRLLRRRRAPGRRTAPRAQHVARRRTRERRCATTRSRAAPASPTRAGPRTARRRCTTPTRTSRTAPGADRQGAGRIALVHNGIIENHDELRAELQARGYRFDSQTDTEVIAHLVDHSTTATCSRRCSRPRARLRGAYAIAVFCRDEPHRVVGARAGSPLVLGLGGGGSDGANYIASDAMALAGVTDQIVYLEEGDVVDLQLGKYWITARYAGRHAQGRAARGAHRARPQRRGRAGPLPALHAEGDLRAAARDRRHARRRHRHLARAVRRRRLPHLQGRSTRC